MLDRSPIKNTIRLEIVGPNIVIEDADIELEIDKTNEKKPNYCTCTVYNMAEDTINAIKSKAYYVNCYANINDTGKCLVFSGDLRDLKKWHKPRKKLSKYTKRGKLRKVKKSTVTPKYNRPSVRLEDNGPDKKLIIELQDGFKTIHENFYYKVAYEGAISNTIILNNCIKTLKNGGIGIGQIDTPNEFIFTNGYSHSGSIYDLMSKMAALGSCNISIQNGVISCIKRSGKNLDWVYVLDGTTCEEPEADTNKEINVSAPILPTLNPDNMIKLDFPTINGVYKVYKLKLKINNYGGDGQGTDLTCKEE